MAKETKERVAFNKVFITNKYHVPIVKCCASCKHCEGDAIRGEVRICLAGHGERYMSYLCKDGYEISDKINDIRLSADGKIKKPAYIKWLIEQVDALDEQNLDEKDKRDIIYKLPFLYEKKFGTRFMDV